MTSYFAGIVDFIGGHPHYALTAIFLLALSEAIPVIGTIVPGSTLIIGICALATGAHVNPWPLLGAAILGAIFGDGLSFWLGRRYHREILLHWPLNRYPQFVDRSEAFIKTYGGASVFLARFIAIVEPARLIAWQQSAINLSVRKRLGFTPQENDRMGPTAEDGRR